MRIAIVSHSFPPARLGGAEIYAESYSRALASAGHDVFVYAAEKNISQRDGSVRVEKRGAVEVHWFTNNLFYEHFDETFDRPGAGAPFIKFLKHARPEIVHFQHFLDVGATLAREVKMLNPKIATAFTVHDYWFTCPRFGQRYHPKGYICEKIQLSVCAECVESMEWRQPRGAAAAGAALHKIKRATGIDLTKTAKGALAKIRTARGKRAATSGETAGALRALERRELFFTKEVYAYLDIIFSPTRGLASEIARHGVPNAKIETAPLGIEPLAAAPRTLHSQKLQIAFHGQFTKPKAPDLLLKAFGAVAPRARAKATLTLRGAVRDPVYYKELRSLASASGAVIEPPFDRGQLAEKLAKTDLLVVPSVWWENSPLAIWEAFQTGVAVLVANHGGMAEMVEEGLGGFRFEPASTSDLTHKLSNLILHPETCRDAARNAPRVRQVSEDARELPARILEAARQNELNSMVT